MPQHHIAEIVNRSFLLAVPKQMTTPKDIHPIVMKVLDELSEKYFIHKRPTIKKSDNLELGWGGKGGRKTTINFTFITERPERSEIEREVKGILEEMR